MKKPSRWMAVLGGLIACAMLLLGCSASPQASSASKGNEGLSQFRVGIFAPDVTFSPFYVGLGPDGALAKSLKDRGIDLKIQTIPNGNNLVAALNAGSVDAAIVPGTSVLAVSGQGGGLAPLMNMFDGPSQQLIAKASAQSSLASYNKKRWAFSRVGSISEISAKLAAEGAGLTWKDQQQIPLGNGSETQAVLDSGRADILATSPGNSAAAVAAGTAVLVNNPQADESSPIAKQLNAVFASSPKFISAHPDLVQDIVTALVKDLSALTKAPSASAALAMTADDFKQAVGKSWDLQWEYSKSGFSRATGGFSAAEIQQTIAAGQMVGMLKSDQAPQGLFDNKYVVKAYQQLGLQAPAGLS